MVRVGDEVEVVGLSKETRKTIVTGVEMFNKTLMKAALETMWAFCCEEWKERTAARPGIG